MANEVTIRASLQVKSGFLNFQSPNTGTTDSVAIAKGPCVSTITVETGGTLIDFSELTSPGWCFIQNLDQITTVDYGIYDTINETFFPIHELPPGMGLPVKFSFYLGESYDLVGTGTGTSALIHRVMFKARTNDAFVLIQCFDR